MRRETTGDYLRQSLQNRQKKRTRAFGQPLTHGRNSGAESREGRGDGLLRCSEEAGEARPESVRAGGALELLGSTATNHRHQFWHGYQQNINRSILWTEATIIST